jgi:hypothetical protein
MSERKAKLKLPAVNVLPRVPLIKYAGRGDEGRDVSKPIAYDEHGNPLYAPRGIVYRIP